uniref:Uncharacterized protein n=1 Tax=Panagrolaimus superbus TaxID=310955 RepID=A0A914Z634_9BILA
MGSSDKSEESKQQQQHRRRHHRHRGNKIVSPQIQSHFAGVQDEKAIYKLLRPTQFILYYKRSKAKSLDDLSYSIPLMMGYMSNNGIVHHFPVKVDSRVDGSLFWHVDLGPENKNKQPYFASMSALINFYEGFVSLKRNGDVEVFPVSDLE